MTTLDGKTALVTGAASGIGRAIAKALWEDGAGLVLLDRDARALASWTGALNVRTVAIDLAQRPALVAAIDEILSATSIDILVNAAGVTGGGAALVDLPDSEWDQVYAVNATAPFLLMSAVGRQMVARGQGGRIVNITSSSAHRAMQSKAAYGASKAALTQLTRTAAAEFGPHDINVNAVAPGLTLTPMVTQAFSPDRLAEAVREGPLANLLGRASEPQDVAAVVLFLCQPASRQITGQTLHVSAGAIV